MSTILNFLFSEIVVVPLVMGIIKFKKIEKSYRPFVILLLAGVITEFVSYFFFIRLGNSNASASKVYSLLECLIILFLFHGWGFLKDRAFLFYSLTVTCFLFWLIENIVFFGTDQFIPFFSIFYSFVIVLVSINEVNYLIIETVNKNLFKNSKFLICIGFVIFFIYQILYEAAYIVTASSGSEYMLTNNIIKSFNYVNFAVNLLYIPAVYFIPERSKFFFSKKSKFDLNNQDE